MRRLVIVLALVGCDHSRASGPAWPKPSTTADDGGESIEPRERAKMVVVEHTDDAPEVKPAAAPAATATNPEIVPAASAPAVAPPVQEDILLNEDIIIEIDD